MPGPTPNIPPGPGYDEDLWQRAKDLCRSNLVIDGHIDFPNKLRPQQTLTSTQCFDFERAKTGGLDAAFMPFYIPSSLQQRPGAALERMLELKGATDIFLSNNSAFAARADGPEMVERNRQQGLFSFIYCIENGSAIEQDIGNVERFCEMGIRYITLVHAKNNQICDSSFDETRVWNGLSPFGREVVAEMNRLGIIVDLSHTSDDTFWQVLKISSTPVICSHSSCRHFTPDSERNMSDEMIRALADHGGLMMINFGSYFLREEANIYGRKRAAHRDAFMQIHDFLTGEEPEVLAEMARYAQENPYPHANAGHVARHIEHVIDLVGDDYVGIGSDFDGVGDTLPVGLKSVSDYPCLVYHLLSHNYSEERVAKVLGLNTRRVWQQIISG